VNSIQNQAIVSVNGTGSEILADITVDDGPTSFTLKINGTSTLTPIQALSLISVFHEGFKNAWISVHETKGRPQS
jgi:hypothetical protein